MGTVEPSEDEFREMLNEIYDPVEVCGCTFNAGDALKELDPTAFRCGYNDYCSESVRYSCDECGTLFELETDAEECCRFECNECGTKFDTEEKANYCAAEDRLFNEEQPV